MAVGGVVLGRLTVVFWSGTVATLVDTIVLGAYHVAATRNGLLVRAAEVATADANAAD